jgi:hypothetical protein
MGAEVVGEEPGSVLLLVSVASSLRSAFSRYGSSLPTLRVAHSTGSYNYCRLEVRTTRGSSAISILLLLS